MKKIIFTEDQYNRIVEDDTFSYLDNGDENGNYKEYPESEVASVGKVGDKYGEKPPTSDEFGNMLAPQNYWWTKAKTIGGGGVTNYRAESKIIENNDVDINNFLDTASQSKIEAVIEIINSRCRDPRVKYKVLEYLLTHISRENMSSQQKSQLRTIVMS